MIIGIAADHGGFELKNHLRDQLSLAGFEFRDFGAHDLNPEDDYPDLIFPLAQAIGRGEVQRGIAICGSGVGASIVANKVAGVRAALITETYSAHQGVEHDDLNVLCLGARVIGPALAEELTYAFLKAKFIDEGRFRRRLDKLLNIEDLI